MDTSITEVEQRITVALISKAAADLASTHERTNLTQTDIVNRAISLYEFIDSELAAGAEVLLRRADNSTYLVGLA